MKRIFKNVFAGDILVAISGIYTFACLVGILNLKHRLFVKVLPNMDPDAAYNNVSQAVNMRDLRIMSVFTFNLLRLDLYK